MSKLYSLSEIKVAAYNCIELPNLSYREEALWQGLAYAYECYRCGHPKAECEKLVIDYINFYWDGEAYDS